jgi:hypothetical protein
VKDNSILKYVEGLHEFAAMAPIPGLEATLKSQWGPFLQSCFLGLKDNPNADEDEVAALVKQLIMFDNFKVGQLWLAATKAGCSACIVLPF